MLVRACHLELHDTRVGQPHVGRRVIGRVLEHALEDTACTQDLIALQRLERRATLNPRPMRSKQLLERAVSRTRGRLRDSASEAIPLTRNGLDKRLPVWPGTKRTPQRRHCL